MRIAPEVAEAVAGGRPVVALESTLISHGLPRPRNLEVAHEVEAAVRDGGATPATIAMVAGEARVGLDADGFEGFELAGLEDAEGVGGFLLFFAAAGAGAMFAQGLPADGRVGVEEPLQHLHARSLRSGAPRSRSSAGTARAIALRPRGRPQSV